MLGWIIGIVATIVVLIILCAIFKDVFGPCAFVIEVLCDIAEAIGDGISGIGDSFDD